MISHHFSDLYSFNNKIVDTVVTYQNAFTRQLIYVNAEIVLYYVGYRLSRVSSS